MFKKYKKFIIFAFVLILIKQILVGSLPIFAIGKGNCDDQLMVLMETNLLQFKWLGDFNSLTFVKGMFFPLFLAISATIGISYINMVTLLYSLACLLFMYSIKDIIKNKYAFYIIFAVLLFNPITYDLEVIQRVYRNSLTPIQVLFIFSTMFLLFQNRKNNNKTNWLWSILNGINLACFWNTREDAIWILPMVIVYTLIMIIEYIILNKNKFRINKIILFIMPFIILFGVNTTISLINYKVYGVYNRVDVSSSSFADAIQAIYSVPTEKDIEYTSVTKEKLEKIYEISPSMNSIKESLTSEIEGFDINGRILDGEIEDGWFWWALRYAAEREGYFQNAKKSSLFFKNVTTEIKEAQRKGLIGKQTTMPSALMSPWRKGYFSKLLKALGNIIIYTNSFENVSARTEFSLGSNNQIELFEIATNDKTIEPNVNSKVSGYYIYNKGDYTINVSNDLGLITSIECKKKEICLIDINFNEYKIDNLDNVYLKINNSNNDILETLYLKDELTNDNNDDRSYYFYDYSTINPSIYDKKISSYYVSRVNYIGNIYKYLGLIVSIIGLISYFVITYYSLIKNRKLIDVWLIITSIFLSYFVLCGGVAYNEISSCGSITTLYLCGAYPLIIMFNSLSIGTLINILKKDIKL